MFNKKLLAIATGAALLIGAQSGFAASQSTTANFDITLTDTCTVTATGATFPSLPASTTADQLAQNAGSVDVTCANGQAYDWGIDGGANHADAAGFTDTRHLKSGAVAIPYTLWQAGSRISDRGLAAYGIAETMARPDEGTYVTIKGVGLTGNGAVQSYPLDADIYFNTLGPYPAGTYTDTVNVYVVW